MSAAAWTGITIASTDGAPGLADLTAALPGVAMIVSILAASVARMRAGKAVACRGLVNNSAVSVATVAIVAGVTVMVAAVAAVCCRCDRSQCCLEVAQAAAGVAGIVAGVSVISAGDNAVLLPGVAVITQCW